MKKILNYHMRFGTLFLFNMLFLSQFIYSQYTLYSENDFWSYAYTVNNHTFKVQTKFGTNAYSPSPENSLTSTSCGIHEGTFLNLNSNSSTADNSVKIEPVSSNDVSDYTDGVSALDLLRIDQHITGSSPFTNGFQKLSADAENDLDIDTFDRNQIRDLILGIRDDLDRNSWEWMSAHEISMYSTAFLNDPWNYCSSNLGGVIEITGLTRTQIENGVNTGIRCTKIGDVYATSGTSANSWVCGSGSYFKSPQTVETRSNVSNNRTDLLGIGTEIAVSLHLKKYEDILSIELPIFLDPTLLEIKSVVFDNGFGPYWNYNKDLKRLVLLQWNQNPLHLESGTIATIHLVAKSTNFDINKAIKFDPNRNVEISNRNMELANATVGIVVENIESNGLDARILQSFAGSILETNVKEDTEAEIRIVNVQGQNLESMKVYLNKGNNRITLPTDHQVKGIKILNLSSKMKSTTLKYID